MSFLTRYADDASEPSVRSALADIGRRALLPSLGLAAVNLAVGWVIKGPLRGFKAEQVVNERLQEHRTPGRDRFARIVSHVGGVSGNIGRGLVSIAFLQGVTRKWWVAILPGVALISEAWMHPVVSAIINRPRPDVPQLDVEQPTSSFPSGHQGATLAQMVIYLLLAHNVPRAWWKPILQAYAVAFPVALAYSRLYLGMHHATDVAVGVMNGLVCGLLGWNYLQRTPASAPTPAGSAR